MEDKSLHCGMAFLADLTVAQLDVDTWESGACAHLAKHKLN
jgi:hypothetical protein